MTTRTLSSFPFLSRTGNVWHASLHTAFAFLSFTQRKQLHMLPLFLYSNIEDSTFHQPQAGPPLSPERETYGMLLFVQLSHSYLLHRGSSSTCYRYSYTPTYSILLSTTSQPRPGCSQYGNQRFHNSMDLQPMTTNYCRHSPSLSREGNVSHASVNQLLHSCPLQEQNIPLHSCNLQGLHGPAPRTCRQQTNFAAFILSLQRGKRAACFR